MLTYQFRTYGTISSFAIDFYHYYIPMGFVS